jgi:hypothetical protein
VEGIPELARGRERWWRSVPKDRRFPRRSEQRPELRAVMDEMLRRDAEADLTGFARAQAEAEDGPWADAFPLSRGSIDVTLEELKDFFEEYIALLYKYRRPERETPPGRGGCSPGSSPIRLPTSPAPRRKSSSRMKCPFHRGTTGGAAAHPQSAAAPGRKAR